MHASGTKWMLVCACALLLDAQPRTSGIRVMVADPSGAPMEAVGRLENLTNGTTRTFRTDAQGTCTLSGIALGRYRVEVRKRGFATQSATLDVQSPDAILHTVTMPLTTTAFNIDVVGTTPLDGPVLALEDIPAAVQRATQRDLEASGAADLSDFLNRRLSGVHLNEIQGNPFQPNLNYRGYTTSPLLGTPQGVSIYLDGVRLNQPFGDVVNWDLIPKIAIAEVTLMPGSNPLFGLNTLGGALSLRSKDGLVNPGASLQLSGGSFGRKVAELEHGGAAKGLNWFLAASLFFDEGWRQSSPSDVRQFFGRIGWQHKRTFLGVSAAYANNALTGNGLQEQRLLARDFASVYTKPDITANRAPFVNFTARHSIGTALQLAGNAYYRAIRTNTLNGDLNEESLDQSVYQPNAAERAALAAAGYSGFPTSGANASNTPFPFWRCIAQSLLGDEPDEKCNGLLNRSHSEQHNYGFAGQLSRQGRHRFTAGGAFDRSHVDFQQSTQFGYLNPDRSVTGVDAHGDSVDLQGLTRTWSLYATDTFALTRALTITLSGRYNRTTLDNADRLQPGGGPGSLDGDYSFGRLNPAIGVTFSPTRAVTAYASYSEGSRAPTSIELGCADPNQPCKLPNAMAGDPPLKQVLTRTVEAGLRGGREDLLHWTIGFFRADNRDDILFAASGQSGFGYFMNFGRTRRQGFEADLNSRIRRVTLGLGYTGLDATYRSAESVNGSGNSSNADGIVRIQPGDRIPLIPENTLKAWADVQATSKLSLDLGMMAVSSAYARGNENNLHQSDGQYFLGSGISPGYAVVNLGGQYRLHRRVELFVQVNNLLDRHYASAAQLGPTGFTESGTFIARPLPAVDGAYPVVHATFYAPGAPRTAWGGVRFRW